MHMLEQLVFDIIDRNADKSYNTVQDRVYRNDLHLRYHNDTNRAGYCAYFIESGVHNTRHVCEIDQVLNNVNEMRYCQNGDVLFSYNYRYKLAKKERGFCHFTGANKIHPVDRNKLVGLDLTSEENAFQQSLLYAFDPEELIELEQLYWKIEKLAASTKTSVRLCFHKDMLKKELPDDGVQKIIDVV